MKFIDLENGKIYTDKDGVNAYEFVELRNDQLATFKVCEYDEYKGDYVAGDETVYLTAREVEELV